MIEIQRIYFKNFLSFGNLPTIIDFEPNKKTLVVGRNGEGKCLHPLTMIDVKSVDIQTEQKLKKFLEKKRKKI